MLSATLSDVRDIAASFFHRKQTARRGMYRLLSSDDKLDLRCVIANRAAQRTFDGAYVRSALGEMGFALTVLRLFQREFFWVGTACCVQALCILITAVFRYELSLRYENEFLQAAIQKANSRTSENTRECFTGDDAHTLGDSSVKQTYGSIDHSVRKRGTNQVNADTPSVTTAFAPEPTPWRTTEIAEDHVLLLPHFWTAGYVVLFAASMTVAVEIAIIVLLARM